MSTGRDSGSNSPKKGLGGEQTVLAPMIFPFWDVSVLISKYFAEYKPPNQLRSNKMKEEPSYRKHVFFVQRYPQSWRPCGLKIFRRSPMTGVPELGEICIFKTNGWQASGDMFSKSLWGPFQNHILWARQHGFPEIRAKRNSFLPNRFQQWNLHTGLYIQHLWTQFQESTCIFQKKAAAWRLAIPWRWSHPRSFWEPFATGSLNCHLREIGSLSPVRSTEPTEPGWCLLHWNLSR